MFLITHGPGRSGRATGGLSAFHGPNAPQPDEVTFPAGRNWCQRDLRPDLIRLNKRTFVVFIKDAPGQKELKGTGEVSTISGEDRGPVEYRAQDVIGAVTRRIVPDELTDLTVVLLRSKVMIACGNHIANADTYIGAVGHRSYRKSYLLDRRHWMSPIVRGEIISATAM